MRRADCKVISGIYEENIIVQERREVLGAVVVPVVKGLCIIKRSDIKTVELGCRMNMISPFA